MRKETAERFLRAINRGLRGHQRLLAPIAGLALLAACASSNPEINTQSLASTPTIASSDISKPFDYCQPITDASSPVEQSLVGRSVPKRPITVDPPKPDSGPDDIDQVSLNLASFERHRIYDPSRIPAVLVPVGYEKDQIDPSMEYIEDILKEAYLGINVEFSHLNVPFQLGVSSVSQLVTFNNAHRADRVKEKVQDLYPTSKIVFVVNTREYLGSCCPAIISGHSFKTGYLAAHELAHAFGLSDGHKIAYPAGDVFSEELFRTKDSLSPAIQKAVEKVDAPIVATGNVCRGEAVFTFYNPEENIMMEYRPTDAQFLEDLKNGRRVFNPVQRVMMAQHIDESFSAVRR